MNPPPMKTRFAPSPTGLLHLGNIRTALFNYLIARQQQGVFLLRIEDTDTARSDEKYVTALQEDLRWLGMMWREGPGTTDDENAYLQSRRGEIYRRYFSELEEGRRAYPCFCTEQELSLSRKTQQAAGRPPRYNGRCYNMDPAEVEKRQAEGQPATLRFHVKDGQTVVFDDKVRGRQEFRTEGIGDFVIRRSNGTPAFFFSNAVDDALMGVTLVARGEDHLTNTPRQIVLLQALGLSVPEYAHISLIVGDDGAPLSKRHGSRTVQELRASGFLPLAINNYLARLGHTYQDNSLLDMEALITGFSINRLHKAPARYDEVQLLYWQREAVHRLSYDVLWAWMGEDVDALVPEKKHETFIDTVRANITFPAEAVTWARILFQENIAMTDGARDQIQTADPVFFSRSLDALDEHGTDFAAVSDFLKQHSDVKGKALFKPLRAALTGKLDGPEMAKLLPLIGLDRARKRLSRWADGRTMNKEKI